MPLLSVQNNTHTALKLIVNMALGLLCGVQ